MPFGWRHGNMRGGRIASGCVLALRGDFDKDGRWHVITAERFCIRICMEHGTSREKVWVRIELSWRGDVELAADMLWRKRAGLKAEHMLVAPPWRIQLAQPKSSGSW